MSDVNMMLLSLYMKSTNAIKPDFFCRAMILGANKPTKQQECVWALARVMHECSDVILQFGFHVQIIIFMAI